MIKFEDVSFTYEKETILHKVNLNIEQGQYVAIIGDNGAGKSTLLKLLIGELKNYHGHLEIGDEFKTIGYVPQNTLNRQMGFPSTVLEIVEGNLYQSIGRFKFSTKKHREQAFQALKLVNMEEHQAELIKNLSGGQQQRVMLARSLVNKPDLLILDEPTSGVDRKSSAQFFETLKQLNQQGLTIVLVTHNVDHLSDDVSDIYLLEEGHCEKVK